MQNKLILAVLILIVSGDMVVGGSKGIHLRNHATTERRVIDNKVFLTIDFSKIVYYAHKELNNPTSLFMKKYIAESQAITNGDGSYIHVIRETLTTCGETSPGFVKSQLKTIDRCTMADVYEFIGKKTTVDLDHLGLLQLRIGWTQAAHRPARFSGKGPRLVTNYFWGTRYFIVYDSRSIYVKDLFQRNIKGVYHRFKGTIEAKQIGTLPDGVILLQISKEEDPILLPLSDKILYPAQKSYKYPAQRSNK